MTPPSPTESPSPISPAPSWRDVRVSLGPDAEVTGKLSFSVPTRIEGKLKGELRASDVLIVGAQAVVNATVQAAQLIVLGEVRGQVLGANRVEICAGGRLFGDVESRSLVVREGALFEGRSRMNQGARAASQPGVSAWDRRPAPGLGSGATPTGSTLR